MNLNAMDQGECEGELKDMTDTHQEVTYAPHTGRTDRRFKVRHPTTRQESAPCQTLAGAEPKRQCRPINCG